MSKKTPFAVHGTTLFVKLRYVGISHLIILLDGISLTYFGKGKTAYLKVSQAISWHEKELFESNGKSGSSKILEALKMAESIFNEGRCVEQ